MLYFVGTENIQQGTNSIIYDSLCRKHNDFGYNKWVQSAHGKFPNWYPKADVESIIVTSDADFDAKHPRGTSLNDIIMYEAYTTYPYIQNGYNGTEKTQIQKLLSLCTKADFLLTRSNYFREEFLNCDLDMCRLYFVIAPTIAQQHNISITINDDDGKSWKTTSSIKWE